MDQKEFIKNYDFKFKKKFGQNFLTDENVLTNIVKCSEIDKNTLVVEIGPGAGALTKKLVKVAKRVVAYEIDETLKPILDTIDADIIYGDFLKRNIKEAEKRLRKNRCPRCGEKLKKKKGKYGKLKRCKNYPKCTFKING